MKKDKNVKASIPSELVERRIYLVHGQKVMLDVDLADLYQVSTKNLNLAVRRNIRRFPSDFMFQLKRHEYENLRLQFATSSWGGRRYEPYVFTELGVGMLSSVLRSDRAVQMNIFIIRAFVKLREILSTHKDLAYKLEELERIQKKQGQQLIAVYSIIKRFMDTPVKRAGRIGFNSNF